MKDRDGLFAAAMILESLGDTKQAEVARIMAEAFAQADAESEIRPRTFKKRCTKEDVIRARALGVRID